MRLTEEVLRENWPRDSNSESSHSTVKLAIRDLRYHSGVIRGLRLSGLDEEKIISYFVQYLNREHSREIVQSCHAALNHGIRREVKSLNEKDREDYSSLSNSYQKFLEE